MSAPTAFKETRKCSEGPEVDEEVNDNESKILTKSQLKKLKKKEKWEQVKAQKRKAEKQRVKERKRACRERGEDVGPTRKQLKHNKMSKSKCKIRVAIDCDFDEYMTGKDIKMLVKQIQFSYSANRRAENPLQFYCCGVNGKTKERLESIGDYIGWDIYFSEKSYVDTFEKSSVVYLSSESPNILQDLEEDKVYIIGGLVDHNHHKGLSHKLAEEKGMTHAQLPISGYIDMKTRKVLTVNHVFEILLHYTETNDWQKAFYTVLPPRKGAIPKNTSSSDNNLNQSQDSFVEKNEKTDDNNAGDRLIDDDAKPVSMTERPTSNLRQKSVKNTESTDGEGENKMLKLVETTESEKDKEVKDCDTCISEKENDNVNSGNNDTYSLKVKETKSFEKDNNDSGFKTENELDTS